MGNKLVVILGPTASGKSDLAVLLAKKFNGEIVSADSRQIYKGLNAGSGKITKQEMQGIPHHLLDIANPKKKFTVAQFQTLATKKIQEIQQRNKLPLLVGGTGFYIQSVVDGIVIPEVKPNLKLRKTLEKKSVDQLLAMLKKLDPARAKHIDAKNPVRLIRAIEIVKATKKPVQKLEKNSSFEVLEIGISKSPDALKKAIKVRLLKRMPKMIAEVKKLRNGGLSFKRLEELGLEYRYVAQYIQKKISKQEMTEKLQKEIEHYAKRQMTWFKKNQRIRWIKKRKEAELLLGAFLKNA
jgi:tRNA dimethylallyltransferase